MKMLPSNPTADNIAYTLRAYALYLRDIAPFGRNVVYARNITQNAASLERLDGVRILANGWRLSGTK